MKIALGMSGGVDSSLSAVLLKDAGHDVTGVFLECWRAPGCRAEEDRKDALAVALDLGIPFRVLDFKDAYRQRVVEEFFHGYENGLTPNPDIWCNTEIKFGLFYEWAMKQGFDAIATGHYAQILRIDPTQITSGRMNLGSTSKNSLAEDRPGMIRPEGNGGEDGPLALVRGADEKKDQTYFLYRTRREQLEHIVFPIGHLTKAQVRQLAKEKNLPVAEKPDSQGICFIGDIDVRDFLRERFGEKEGDVLDVDGNIVGCHRGHWLYTIGQRHGFELFPKIHTSRQEWKHVLPPLYVVSKDAQNNTITVGFGVETLIDRVKLTDVFWRAGFSPEGEVMVKARVRHGGQLLDATLTIDEEICQVMFAEPQRGLAPGQSVVIYDAQDDRICWGGGVIA